MGCGASAEAKKEDNEKSPLAGPIVFTPAPRIPKAAAFRPALTSLVSPPLVGRLEASRSKLAVELGFKPEKPQAAKDKVKGGSGKDKEEGGPKEGLEERKVKPAVGKQLVPGTVKPLAEDYMRVLQGLCREGNALESSVEFGWTNSEDRYEESTLKSAFYELLSTLHIEALACMLEANNLLAPRSYDEASVSLLTAAEKNKAAFQALTLAAGILECGLVEVLPKVPAGLRSELPADVSEPVLRALKLQCQAQAVEIQLDAAVDSVKSKVAEKLRLATEIRQYWQEAASSLRSAKLGPGWGAKHELFVRWKLAHARASALYFHGLLLDEGSAANTHADAVAVLRAAEGALREGEVAAREFGREEPLTRTPKPMGAWRVLVEAIVKDAGIKERVNKDVYYREKPSERMPEAPGVTPALVVPAYKLPSIDEAWAAEPPPKKPPGGGAPVKEQVKPVIPASATTTAPPPATMADGTPPVGAPAGTEASSQEPVQQAVAAS